jgi:regulator of RNase E activity RraA
VARIAQIRGALGVVTDDMVRDAAEIIALGLPVFCRGVTPNSASPSGPGEVGLPLAMGEVTVESGDLIIGDRDGVAVVPRTQLAAVTARLELVAAREGRCTPRWPRARPARCWSATQSWVTRSPTWIDPRHMGASTRACAR